jgi:hypothetical protein
VPIDGAAGFSEYTAIKQRDFGYVMETLIKIAKSPRCMGAEWAHPEYLYIDLNAGSGVVGGYEGSPLIFARAAQRLGLRFRGWLFERDQKSVYRLEQALRESCSDVAGCFSIVCGDHNETVPRMLERGLHTLPKDWVFGLVYADPNGQIDLPLGPMRLLAERFPRVDQLVNVGATTYKRTRGAGLSDAYLLDDLETVHKRHRLLRRVVGRWQWTMALLTNWPNAPEFSQIGFRKSTSAEGQQISRDINFSSKELSALLLPLDLSLPTVPMPSTSVIPASSPSEPRRWRDAVASANAADSAERPSPTT